MTASILVGFIAKAFGDRVCYTAVTLAGVVVLLPGLLLTQAIMELSSRNVVSGAVRMFYALMYAFFLGFGLTLGADFWDYVRICSVKKEDNHSRPNYIGVLTETCHVYRFLEALQYRQQARVNIRSINGGTF